MTRIAMVAAALCAVGAAQFLTHTVLEGHRILAASGLLGGGQVVHVERARAPESVTEAARMQRASLPDPIVVTRGLVGAARTLSGPL